MILKEKLEDKSSTVCVIGLGYVGLPLACSFAKAGFKVVGLDIDQAKITQLSKLKSYISYIDDSVIEELANSKFPEPKFFELNCIPLPSAKFF